METQSTSIKDRLVEFIKAQGIANAELEGYEDGESYMWLEHCPGGRGKKGGLSEYARQIGKGLSTISECNSAAKVFAQAKGLDVVDLLGRAKHLSAIHKAPEQYWQQLTELLIEKEWSVKQTETLLTPSKPAIGTETSQNFVDIHEVCPSLFPRLVSG